VHMGGVRAAFHAQASSMISCLKTHPLNQLFQPKTSATTFEPSPRILTDYATCKNATRYPASYNNFRFPVVLRSTDVNTNICATHQLELLEDVMYARTVGFPLTSSSDQDNLLLCDWNCESGKMRSRNCQDYLHCLEPETPQLALDHFSPGRDGLCHYASLVRLPRISNSMNTSMLSSTVANLNAHVHERLKMSGSPENSMASLAATIEHLPRGKFVGSFAAIALLRRRS
jgi:hypothetical protein